MCVPVYVTVLVCMCVVSVCEHACVCFSVYSASVYECSYVGCECVSV